MYVPIQHYLENDYSIETQALRCNGETCGVHAYTCTYLRTYVHDNMYVRVYTYVDMYVRTRVRIRVLRTYVQIIFNTSSHKRLLQYKHSANWVQQGNSWALSVRTHVYRVRDMAIASLASYRKRGSVPHWYSWTYTHVPSSSYHTPILRPHG